MNLKKVKDLNIPKKPGSYQFYCKTGKIIYIGKAADLRSRVLSYWRTSANHTPAKYAMMKEITKIKWIETDSEIEALLLEANLVKKYQPRYNVDLRDDKRHAYIKVSTEEEWPRIYATRQLERSGRYFGPFISNLAVKETLKIIRRIWPYRSCNRLPKKVCLYYRIGKCLGMCEDLVNKDEYRKVVKQVVLFLEGKKNKLITNYELRITNFGKKLKKLKPESKRYLEIEEKLHKEMYILDNLKKILEQNNIISLIDKYAADVVELAKVLELPCVPERIEGYDISNIFGKQAVGSMVVFRDGEPDKSQYRKFKIKLSEGKANDTMMLKEVLGRRLKHTPPPAPPLIRGGEKGEGSWKLPDLIIIDGAKAQLNAALSVLKKLNLDLQVIAVSKGKGMRSAQAPDKIFFPEELKPLELPLASPALHIIKRVRDEAHRFAINYHKLLRKKRFYK